jgi:hypothetical protein
MIVGTMKAKLSTGFHEVPESLIKNVSKVLKNLMLISIMLFLYRVYSPIK